jgi:hypothetical protein
VQLFQVTINPVKHKKKGMGEVVELLESIFPATNFETFWIAQLCHNLGYLILIPAREDRTIVNGAVNDKPFMCLKIFHCCPRSSEVTTILGIFIGTKSAVKRRYCIVVLLCVFHEICRRLSSVFSSHSILRNI